MTRLHRTEYRVSWRRRGWGQQRQERVFDTLEAAVRYADRLKNGDREVEPLTMLSLHQRPVGNWEQISRWVAPDEDGDHYS